MNELYLDLHIAAPPDESVREIIPAALSDFHFEGFVEDERGIHCYIKKEAWTGSADAVVREMAEQYQLQFVELISVTEVRQQNWNEEWERTIQPIAVSDRFVITPSWHPVTDPGKLVIVIDPKMTFGTGYHETTRLMLRLMERTVRAGSRVLDVGTGTGILAIAAAMLGAKEVLGVDIDEWSLDNGIENAERNGVRDTVQIRIGSLDAVTETGYDLILANIIRATILELLDGIIAKLGPNGTILFSGLLATDREIIEPALTQRGLIIREALAENEWIALEVTRA